MTLESTTVKVSYAGDDATVSFPVTFIYWDDTDIEVILRADATGAETTWVDGTQYTLSGGDGATGTLTVDTSPTDYTPATGETLVIRSNREDKQSTAFPLGGSFPSTSAEDANDKQVRLTQQRTEELSRTIKVSKTSPLSDLELPEPAANQLLAWNAAEDGFDNVVPLAGSVILDEDDMASDSNTQAVSQQSIVRYVRIFPTVDLIRSSIGPFKDNQIATLVEYDAGFQGAGGGQLFWDAASTTSDNNITVYKVASIATGRFKRIFSGGVKAVWAGAVLDGVEDDTDAITDTVATGNSEIILPYGTLTLSADVDCNGAKIICAGTILPNSNTLINHGGIVNGVLSGVDTTDKTIHPRVSQTFENHVLLQALNADSYMLYSPKKNSAEGLLEFELEQNLTTTTNSIGGNCAHRVVGVRNVNALVAYKHTYDSASAVPAETVTRSYGGGTGGSDITYYTIAPTESITFSSTLAIDILGIGFLLTGASSPDVDITVDGVLLKNITLVKATAEEELYLFRERIRATTGDIVITNNSATLSAFVAGINYFELTDDMQGDIDTFAFSRNTKDFTQGGGAADYALRRPGVADATGGSYHGGETVNANTFYLDFVAKTLSTGDIAYGKRFTQNTNVTITWGDATTATVVRLNTIGDGSLLKEIEIQGGSVVFDNVWTSMWPTPETMTNIRLATDKGVGITSTMVALNRVTTVRQDEGAALGVINSFTLYDNERNSNGGPYVNEVGGIYNKLYYGPILFNSGTIGEIHAVQFTEFFGRN